MAPRHYNSVKLATDGPSLITIDPGVHQFAAPPVTEEAAKENALFHGAPPREGDNPPVISLRVLQHPQGILWPQRRLKSPPQSALFVEIVEVSCPEHPTSSAPPNCRNDTRLRIVAHRAH
jgi:hypothetical protein